MLEIEILKIIIPPRIHTREKKKYERVRKRMMSVTAIIINNETNKKQRKQLTHAFITPPAAYRTKKCEKVIRIETVLDIRKKWR